MDKSTLTPKQFAQVMRLALDVLDEHWDVSGSQISDKEIVKMIVEIGARLLLLARNIDGGDPERIHLFDELLEPVTRAKLQKSHHRYFQQLADQMVKRALKRL